MNINVVNRVEILTVTDCGNERDVTIHMGFPHGSSPLLKKGQSISCEQERPGPKNGRPLVHVFLCVVLSGMESGGKNVVHCMTQRDAIDGLDLTKTLTVTIKSLVSELDPIKPQRALVLEQPNHSLSEYEMIEYASNNLKNYASAITK